MNTVRGRLAKEREILGKSESFGREDLGGDRAYNIYKGFYNDGIEDEPIPENVKIPWSGPINKFESTDRCEYITGFDGEGKLKTEYTCADTLKNQFDNDCKEVGDDLGGFPSYRKFDNFGVEHGPIVNKDLFKHKNIIINDLNKIRKVNGLDIANIDDYVAIKFVFKKYLTTSHPRVSKELSATVKDGTKINPGHPGFTDESILFYINVYDEMVNSFLFNEKPVWVGNNNYGLTPVSDSLIGNNIEVTENDMRHYSGDYITVSPQKILEWSRYQKF